MGFERWGYSFEGAFEDPRKLKSEPGIYVIWCDKGNDWRVIDVGESNDVKNRILDHHERADCWQRNCQGGTIYYSAHYMTGRTELERVRIEQLIRNQTVPPCGER